MARGVCKGRYRREHPWARLRRRPVAPAPAVVEAFGLGAMAIELSPEQKKVLGAYLPDNSNARVTGLSAGSHPYFRSLDIRLGSTARGAVAQGSGPAVGLGILDRLGQAGRLGGGIYDMPVDPFSAAVKALKA